MKDVLPTKIGPSECGIINLENSDSGGSHWVAYYNSPTYSIVEYFDSFGVMPPRLVEKYLATSNKRVAFNTIQYQHLGSILCGWFCLLFINERNRGTDPWDIFCFLLSTATEKNDALIRGYFKNCIPFHTMPSGHQQK